jgi:hypothetical protein
MSGRLEFTISEETVKKATLLAILSLVLLFTFAGCFPGGRADSAKEPAGFFLGVWHGWIAPVSLVVGLFKDGVRIYEPFNSGWWYDFGFYIAVIAGFGGIALSRGNKNRSERS